jgi:hypothetical protein
LDTKIVRAGRPTSWLVEITLSYFRDKIKLYTVFALFWPVRGRKRVAENAGAVKAPVPAFIPFYPAGPLFLSDNPDSDEDRTSIATSTKP